MDSRIKKHLRKIRFLQLFKNFLHNKKLQFSLYPSYLGWMKNRSGSTLPVLDYIETHLASHCNLKCGGCSHFSPLSDTWFASIEDHKKDFERLRSLFADIRTIRLLGGEPLLHPDVESFIKVTRLLFPFSDIRIATNGILMKSMPESFWNVCRQNKIIIDWTVYPPLQPHKRSILESIEDRAKDLSITSFEVKKFRRVLNLKGDSDPKKSFSFCRRLYFCPFLREGRIYVCSRPVTIETFNRKFNSGIPSDTGINIHDQAVTGWDILLSLSRYREICRFCSVKNIEFNWSETSRIASEWDVSS